MKQSIDFYFEFVFKISLASLTTSFFSLKWSEVKVTQPCLTLCHLMDCRVQGNLQATILEWVAVPLSRGSSQPRDWTQVSRIAGWFFTSWATRGAKNTRMSSLFLLQDSSWPKNRTGVSCIASRFFRRERLPTPVFQPGEFCGLYSPWSCKESDRTQQLSLSLFKLGIIIF